MTSIVTLSDVQSIGSIINISRSNLALVVVRTRYVSSVTQKEKACPNCTLSFFFDTSRTLRDLVRALHTQAAYAHGSRRVSSSCALRRDTACSFFVDSATGNPLLPFSPQPLTVDSNINVGRTDGWTATNDGSFAEPNNDALYEETVESLLAQNYLKKTVFSNAASSATRTKSDTFAELVQSAHLPIMCTRALTSRIARQPKEDCIYGGFNCYCTVCCTHRLVCCSVVRTKCTGRTNCCCLLAAVLDNTSTIMHVDSIAGLYDPTSETYSEQVFDVNSPMIIKYLARIGETRATNLKKHFQLFRSSSFIVKLLPDPTVCRRVSFAEYDYDFILARIGELPTVTANLMEQKKFDSIATLKAALAWVGSPARHFIHAAMTDFKGYKKRLSMIYQRYGVVLSRECERTIYNEFRREPVRSIAMNRALVFEPSAPNLDGEKSSYTSTLHADVVVFVMCVVFMIAAAEKATVNKPSTIGTEMVTHREAGSIWNFRQLVCAAETARTELVNQESLNTCE